MKEILIILGITFQICFGILISNSDNQISSVKGTSKVDLRNVSFQILSELSLRNLNEDLTFLKISKSKIGKLDKFAFDKFKHLNLLELSENEIKYEFDPDTFFRLPGLEILVLKSLGLQKINLNLKNVQEVILSNNEIEKIGGNEVRGENVNYLDVSGNFLESLTESFGNLEKLSTIDFSKNKVRLVGKSVFEQNLKLIRILASDNKINSTQGFRLPWLKALDLYANRLESLESEAFAGMESLEELTLAFNSIKVVDDPFKHLFELKFLNVAWNRIEELASDIFRNNLYLTKLELQGNKLKKLTKFPSILYHLSYLDLSHNELEVVDKDFFGSLPKVKTLNLSFNRLLVVSDIFSPLPSLKILNLAYNRISLSGNEFLGNLEITHLNLSSNGLSLGINCFRNNVFLKSLDLSNNKISNICDSEISLSHLMKLNLKQNSIKNLDCLDAKKFHSLCLIDLRGNPLQCGQNLDYFLSEFAAKTISPFANINYGHHLDVSSTQCESLTINQSMELWTSVKRALCPKNVFQSGVNSEEKEIEKPTEKLSEKLARQKKKNISQLFMIRPIGSLRKNDIFHDSLKVPQSEKNSWEQIIENVQQEDYFDEEKPILGNPFITNAVAPILIVLSVVLVVLIFGVSLYFRIKCVKALIKDITPKYTVIQNDVYKFTTEPTNYLPNSDCEAFSTKNKISLQNKLMNILGKKEKAADKKILMHSEN